MNMGRVSSLGVLFTMLLSFACMPGCEEESQVANSSMQDHDHNHDAHGHSHAEDDHDHPDHRDADQRRAVGVDIPKSVRSNLGISLITVESLPVESTIRAPGRFEYLPTARREYRTMLPGRVELMVNQFDRVEEGQPLYRVDSPAWREMQQRLNEAESDIRRQTTRIKSFKALWAAHTQHETSLKESIDVWTKRVSQLEALHNAGGGRVEGLTTARSSLASVQSELAHIEEKHAQLDAEQALARTELNAAESRLKYLLGSAGSVLGLTPLEITKEIKTDEGSKPYWSMISTIVVVAVEPGVIESLGLTNGSWADERSAVLTVVRPERLRFRASGLQSDLGVLEAGLPVRIVPPASTATGRAIPMTEVMIGELAIGLGGDPSRRTVDLFVTPESLRPWARPGVAAQLEIVADRSAPSMPAVPLAAVQRDGLTSVVFRRDATHPDYAERVEIVLGPDDGRWVAVLEGVSVGDVIVLDGAYQLMLATSGNVEAGGHFHADGTFHDGDHNEDSNNDGGE